MGQFGIGQAVTRFRGPATCSGRGSLPERREPAGQDTCRDRAVHTRARGHPVDRRPKRRGGRPVSSPCSRRMTSPGTTWARCG
jgi:hypothetical protein